MRAGDPYAGGGRERAEAAVSGGGGVKGGLDSTESAGVKKGEPLPLVTRIRMGGSNILKVP